MSLPCRRDIGSSYVSPLSVRQVVVMFPLVDETKVVVMSSPCRRDIGSSYISLVDKT
jgi:hypothetical protein